MTITAAEVPRLANGAERKVWQALIDQLEPGDLVIPGKRVTDHLKDHEIDFFVAIEGAGMVCVEVKGGEVWHDGESWRQKRRGREVQIDPVRQAREACYALRSFVESDPRWTQGRLRWDHVVVGIASPAQSGRLLKKIEVFSEVVVGAALPRGVCSLWPSSWNSRPRMLASAGTALWAVVS